MNTHLHTHIFESHFYSWIVRGQNSALVFTSQFCVCVCVCVWNNRLSLCLPVGHTLLMLDTLLTPSDTCCLETPPPSGRSSLQQQQLLIFVCCAFTQSYDFIFHFSLWQVLVHSDLSGDLYSSLSVDRGSSVSADLLLDHSQQHLYVLTNSRVRWLWHVFCLCFNLSICPVCPALFFLLIIKTFTWDLFPVCLSAVQGSRVIMWETKRLSVLSCYQWPILWMVCPGGTVGLPVCLSDLFFG